MTLLQVIAQAPPDTPRRLADVVQYLTGAGVIALTGFCWRINAQIALLVHPELGVIARVQTIASRTHTHGGKLQEHESRLDGHDRELGRLSDLLDERRTGSTDRRAK